MNRILGITASALALLTACSTRTPADETPGADPVPIHQNPPSKWKDAWTTSIVTAIADDSPLITLAPEGVKDFCPKFPGFSVKDRKLFWANFFEALAWGESEHNVMAKYGETFGVTSRGLLQISVESARAYGNHCEGATADDLHTGTFNVQCGVSILEHQFVMAHEILDEGREPKNKYEKRIERSDGLRSNYYWSTLNPRVNRCGYWRFTKWLANLQDCVRPLERPSGCN